jgi:mRNA interferase RelE/StbE
MAWTIEITDDADRDLEALGSVIRKRVLKFIFEKLAISENPRSLGAPMKGPDFNHTWRYRVGDYRILARIEDELIIIYVVGVGHRREVYR